MANEVVYNAAKTGFVDGTIDWDGGNIKVLALELTSSPTGQYDPDLDTVSAVLGVTNVAEASGTGYSRKTLANTTVTTDDTNDRAVLKGDAVTWTGADWGDCDALLVFYDTGSDATAIPISYHDAGLPVTTNGGDLTYNWAGGSNDEIIRLS